MNNARSMVETFQCPGCIHGDDTRCGKFRLHELGTATSHVDGERLIGGFRCGSHEAESGINGRRINIGLPVPFARVQYREGAQEEVKTNIRMHLYPVNYGTYWDVFNVPVWAMEMSGVLFVRTYSPRIDQTHVDIITGGSMEWLQKSYPTAVDIGSLAGRMEL